jgi:hypothetical protein
MPLHVIFQIGKALFAHPVITGAVDVLARGCVSLMLDFGTVPFGKFGPTASAMIVIPIGTRTLPSLPLERGALQVIARFDAPLLVRVHDTDDLTSGDVRVSGESIMLPRALSLMP